MKILYFTDTYLPQVNGVTNTLDKLARYMDNNKIGYMFFAPYYEDSSSIFEEKNIRRFKSISLPAYPECRLSIPFYSNLCRIADKFKPDIVHLMTPAGLGLAGLRYAQDRGLPVVSSFTTSFDVYLKYYKLGFLNNLIWSFFKWFHNSCSINFCPSLDTSQMLKSKGIKNVKLWSRGIDTDIFNPTRRSEDLRNSFNAEGKITFLYVGRLAPEKDLDILMESIRQINYLYPDKAQFVIAGDGPSAAQLRRSAPGNVIFTGYLKGEKLSSLYASCDVFAFPSSTETFGNVVLEAMASGLPVVAVNSGGVKDSIINGYNGFLCNPRDTKNFTDAVSRFIDDKTLINKMSSNAREYTIKKSWNSIYDQLVSDYNILTEQFYINTNVSTKVS
jgi:glycosyltransferase involved in cell wall biosynthesis